MVLLTHGQVDEGEHIVLDHDGETEEHGVQDQHVHTQLEVQLPLVDVDAQDLHTHTQRQIKTDKDQGTNQWIIFPLFILHHSNLQSITNKITLCC